MSKPEKLLFAYEAGVQDPEISGMEHLDMLLTRNRLAAIATELSEPQKLRLKKADNVLATQSDQFYTAIIRIANLKSWREQENAPPDHWWWYLDVLAAAPIGVAVVGELVLA